ncbi:MAG: YceI family protein [Halobacteriovoraceae bacterium]|nr:YceI family protein [Halobacteriovoraceae bacterium]
MKILLVLLFCFFSRDAFAKKFIIDSSHSSIEFSVKHLGLFPVKGRFTKFEGFIDVDVKKMKAKKVFIKIDVDSIKTDNDDRDAHLKSKDFFHVRNDVFDIVDANRYITFNTRGFSLKGTKKLKGKLRILKEKKTVNFSVKINSMEKQGSVWKIGIVANGKINRKDYGLTWQKPSSGTKEKVAGKFVGDKVDMMVSLTFMDK